MPPGRVGSRRPVPVRFKNLVHAWLGAGLRRGFGLCALTACTAVFSACAAGPAAPHHALAPVWRDYSALPEQRALAIAGELRHDRWVAGASGGHAVPEAAETEALRECQRRRLQKRMQAPCRIYAVGNEVVWPGRGGETLPRASAR